MSKVPEARMRAPSATRRIVYIDGLRGLAVAMVVAYHGWYALRVALHHSLAATTPLAYVASRGFEGVSLFLVLSGFCLSYPLWQRRRDGAERWFVPSEFFARRCLRILPPYYGALILFTAVSVLLAWRGHAALMWVGKPPGLENLLAHVLLVHNLTSYTFAVDAPFWSLGLEWQWYMLFPLVLIACLRFPRTALAAALSLAVVWQVGLHGVGDAGVGTVVLQRLFEFSCGVLAARLVVAEVKLPYWILVPTFVSALLLAEIPAMPHTYVLRSTLSSLGIDHPLCGLAFGSLILLGDRSRFANAVLSWRPLVGLGIISYSVYLMHAPIMEAVVENAPLRSHLLPVLAVFSLAAACGIGLGLLFHLAVERPCMQRATWLRVRPVLTHIFRWTDPLWEGAVARGGRIASFVAPSESRA